MSEQLDVPDFAPAEGFQAPDLIEPVVAFRNWRVVDGRLRSVYEPVFWLDPMQRADCLSDRRGQAHHDAPASGCTCGLYASHQPDHEFPTIDHRGVAGIVTAWGNIEVHADGIRAECMQVEALSIYELWTRRQIDAVRSVAADLGSDVVDLNELENAAGQYGVRLDPAFAELDHPAHI
ncbi:MAG: hypothetical protein C5B48_03175 [Candidatus Rokuibacteriota bacterium]|nr:MAG: hypothetical protein C5B48_03175 [Candidatus Rokubacteria bacterium]